MRFSFAESSIHLELEQTSGETIEGESMQSAVWNAGWALSNAMQHPDVFSAGYWRDKNVLELGAGCGACGIMAAHLGARSHARLPFAVLPPRPLYLASVRVCPGTWC